ncbi:MAG: hypothetical protein AB1716_15545, partial [Planctomycetota bacterium]
AAGRARGAAGAALAVLLITAIFVAVVLHQRPPLIGTYVDDAIYLATGKAIAEGRGYRHIELPHEPYQTKYPILYPALVALVWRTWPDFPQNIVLVQWVNIALWTFGSWCAYRLMVRAWGVPAWLAVAAVILAFTSAATLSVLSTAMSEPLYFALSMAARLTVSQPRTQPGGAAAAPPHASPPHGSLPHSRPPRDSLPHGSPPRDSLTHGSPPRAATSAVAVGALLAAAYLTRSVGVALAVAVVVALLGRRKWGRAAGALAGFAAAAGGWQAWRMWAAAQNTAAAGPVFAALNYDLDYRAWVAGSVGTHLWIAWQNLSDLLLSLAFTLVQLDQTSAARALQAGPGQALPYYAMTLIVAGLVIIGVLATCRRGALAVHLYIASYLALVLAWPFEPARFLIVLAPLLYGLLLAGTFALLRRIGSAGASPSHPTSPSGPTELARTATLVLAAGLGFLQIAPLFSSAELRARLAAELEGREALAGLIRTQTPPNAVISSHWAGWLHLRTGHRFVPPLPGEAQIRIYYAADRTFLGCGRAASPGMRAADENFARARLIGFLRETGATHVVPMVGRPGYERVFEELRGRYAAWFRPAGEAGPYKLYRLDLP